MIGIHAAIYHMRAIVADKGELANRFHEGDPQGSLDPDIIKLSNLHRAMAMAPYNLCSPC